MMRVVHTIAGLQRSHGGTSRSVPALCESLADIGYEVHLLTGRPADRTIECNQPRPPVQTHWIEESSLTGRWLVGSAFRRVLEDLESQSSGNAIIHDHGLWLPSNHAVAQHSGTRQLCRIVSPRGMLSPWALSHGGIKKKIVWWMRQRADLHAASAFHATSEAEASDIREAGFAQPIGIIPNGVNLPPELPRREFNENRRMLFLSRIHPVKGIFNLINAFHRSCLKSDWELVIAGPGDEDFCNQVRSLIVRLELTKRVSIRGAVGDREKWKLYASADLFVLPSFSENFGIAVAEALAAGVPVITTTATPWAGLKAHHAGWWVSPSAEALSEAMEEASAIPREVLSKMGTEGSRWVRSEFQWDSISERMSRLYQWLNGHAPQPDFVI